MDPGTAMPQTATMTLSWNGTNWKTKDKNRAWKQRRQGIAGIARKNDSAGPERWL